MVNISKLVKLGVFIFVIMNVIVVVFLCGLFVEVEYGLSLVFYYLFVVIVFLIFILLVVVELVVMF